MNIPSLRSEACKEGKEVGFWLAGMKGGYNHVTIFSFRFSSLRALRFILLKHRLFVLPHQQLHAEKREWNCSYLPVTWKMFKISALDV
jgi:hypothetical protein